MSSIELIKGKTTHAEISLITAVHLADRRRLRAESAEIDHNRHNVFRVPWGMRTYRGVVLVEVDEFKASLFTCQTGQDTCQPVVKGHTPRGGLIDQPVRALCVRIECRLTAAYDL